MITYQRLRYLWLRSYKITKIKKVIAQIHFKKRNTVPLFIFGCQRSGTTILSETINLCPIVKGYGEGDPPYFYQDHTGSKYLRLKQIREIKELLNYEKSKYILLKPLYDSQYAEEIINIFPNSKGIWIFRNYIDVIESHIKYYSKKYSNVFNGVSYIKNILQLGKKNWQNEVIPTEFNDLFKYFSNIIINSETGYALFWLLRNSLYFRIAKKKRFLLVKYEEFVTKPEQELKNVYLFLNLPYKTKYSSIIHSNSLYKEANLKIDGKINKLCCDMMNRLDEEWNSQKVENKSYGTDRHH